MTLDSMFKGLSNILMAFLNLKLPVGEYRVSFMQILVAGWLFSLIARFIFGIIEGRRGENAD